MTLHEALRQFVDEIIRPTDDPTGQDPVLTGVRQVIDHASVFAASTWLAALALAMAPELVVEHHQATQYYRTRFDVARGRATVH